jgi:SAM-dependent methyltransferase
MSTSRQDWQAWHRDYDDPDSSVSHRLVEVRTRLAAVLAEGDGPVRLLNLCCGDGRDTVPVLASSDREVAACLVELDPDLAEAVRRSARGAGVRAEVRTGDAADPATYADRLPVDVLMLVGVLGNVSDTDAERTVAAAATMVVEGGTVIWSRSSRFRSEPTHGYADPAEWVRDLFEAAGFETVDYLRPEHEAWRLGVGRLREASGQPLPERLFTFVR